MRPIVSPASGRTGVPLTEQAFAPGHEVGTLVRRMPKVGAADG